MTKFIIFFWTSILSFANASGQTIVKGTFKSLPSTEFKIVFNQSALNEFQGEVLQTGHTSPTGQFSSSFQLKSEQPIILFISNQFLRLWAIPNTNLTIEETSNSKFLFSGQASEQNSFLYNSGMMTPMAVPPAITSINFEPQKQIAYIDSVEQKRWALYKNSLDSNKISKAFASYCKGEITYFSYYNKNQYVVQNIFGERKVKKEDIPSNYYDFWNRFRLLDDSYLSDSYQNSLIDYIGYKATKRLNIFNEYPDKEKYNQVEFNIIDSLLANHPLTREKIKAEKLIFLIDYFDLPKFVELEFKKYKDEFPVSAYVSLIQNKWDKKNKNTSTKPDFTLRDTSGSLLNIKSLNGKVVYIDFWGSWCKACLAQIPNSSKLQQRYKSENVVFLFIDFYDTKEKWLKTITDRKITGLHIKAEKSDEKYFIEKFGIGQGFPRYALLDKNGTLITSSAPHPNDREVISLIDKHLNDK